MHHCGHKQVRPSESTFLLSILRSNAVILSMEISWKVPRKKVKVNVEGSRKELPYHFLENKREKTAEVGRAHILKLSAFPVALMENINVNWVALSAQKLGYIPHYWLGSSDCYCLICYTVCYRGISFRFLLAWYDKMIAWGVLRQAWR